MNNSIDAIHEFMNNNEFNVGWEYSSQVCVNKGSECIYCASTEWQMTYDPGYGQYAINIIWNINEDSWRGLQLYGRYNTNFQTFKYLNSMLVIVDSSNNLTISIAGS